MINKRTVPNNELERGEKIVLELRPKKISSLYCLYTYNKTPAGFSFLALCLLLVSLTQTPKLPFLSHTLSPANLHMLLQSVTLIFIIIFCMLVIQGVRNLRFTITNKRLLLPPFLLSRRRAQFPYEEIIQVVPNVLPGTRLIQQLLQLHSVSVYIKPPELLSKTTYKYNRDINLNCLSSEDAKKALEAINKQLKLKAS